MIENRGIRWSGKPRRRANGWLMRRLNILLYVLSFLFIGYYFWSFFVSSRYQALCNVTFWFATKEQVDACREMKNELDEHK
jgi:uncharacterized RDD family membrane protein YckC